MDLCIVGGDVGVSGQWTFSDLCLIYGWQVTTLW